MPVWGQLSLQDAASPTIYQLSTLHDHAILIVLLVVSFVRFVLVKLIINQYTCRTLLHAHEIEAVWTSVPAIILFLLAAPSLHLLYVIDEIPNAQLTFKAIGHQWYWRYEYQAFQGFSFDSYIIPSSDLSKGIYRLLDVDNRAVFPIRIQIQLLTTSYDVIHSWAVPSLGVKIDAIPGRQNQFGFTSYLPGVFYGQCSEICGRDHSFMPIVLEAVNSKTFLNWLVPKATQN